MLPGAEDAPADRHDGSRETEAGAGVGAGAVPSDRAPEPEPEPQPQPQSLALAQAESEAEAWAAAEQEQEIPPPPPLTPPPAPPSPRSSLLQPSPSHAPGPPTAPLAAAACAPEPEAPPAASASASVCPSTLPPPPTTLIAAPAPAAHWPEQEEEKGIGQAPSHATLDPEAGAAAAAVLMETRRRMDMQEERHESAEEEKEKERRLEPEGEQQQRQQEQGQEELHHIRIEPVPAVPAASPRGQLLQCAQLLWAPASSSRAPAGGSPLDRVPLEVLTLALSFVDAGSLVAFSRTSSVHHRLSLQPALWLGLLRAAYGPLERLRLDAPDDPRQTYKSRRLVLLEQRRQHVRHHAQVLELVAMGRRGFAVQCCTDLCPVPLAWLLLAVFLVSLVVQLQRGGPEGVDFVSLWPVLALVAFFTLLALCLCCLRHVCLCPVRPVRPGLAGLPLRAFNSLRLAPGFSMRSKSVVAVLMRQLGRNRGRYRRAHATFCLAMGLLALWLVLLCLRVEGSFLPSGWSWWIIFSPLFGVFACFCAAPLLGWNPARPRWPHMRSTCAAAWAVLGLPLLAFALLLCAWLQDPSSVAMGLVLLPLFLVDAVLLLVAVLNSANHRTWEGMAIWLCADGPLLAFKIMLAVAVDTSHSIPPALLFLPLYMVHLLLLCVCGAYTVKTLSSMRRGGSLQAWRWPLTPDRVDMPLPPV